MDYIKIIEYSSYAAMFIGLPLLCLGLYLLVSCLFDEERKIKFPLVIFLSGVMLWNGGQWFNDWVFHRKYEVYRATVYIDEQKMAGGFYYV